MLSSPIQTSVIFFLYGCALVYGLIFYYLADFTGIVTIILVGIPVFLYLLMYFVIRIGVAAVMGYQSRWSIPRALLHGIPMVLLYGVVCAFGDDASGGKPIGAPVPWIATCNIHTDENWLMVFESIEQAFFIYVIFFAVGLIERMVNQFKSAAVKNPEDHNHSTLSSKSGGCGDFADTLPMPHGGRMP